MQRKSWVLLAVACGTFMATLDSSIINVALHTLRENFASNLAIVKWVVAVYFLVITCLLLPFGRISDSYGRKRIFFWGFFVFTAGSTFCGFAPNIGLLVTARIIQALGAAMLMANGPAIITDAFPAGERGAALGKLAMVVGLGLISGPVLGGFLLATLGWRSIFIINVPIGILGLILVHKHIPKDPVIKKTTFDFDWGGAILQSLFLILIILLFEPPTLSFLSFLSGSTSLESHLLKPIFAVAAAIVLYFFVKQEKRADSPVFDISLLKNQTFWTANLAGFFLFMAYSAATVLLPQFFEAGLAYTKKEAGLLMAAVSAALLVVAPISGKLSDRFGSRELCILGALVESVTFFLMAGVIGPGLNHQVGTIGILIGLSLTGLGVGLFQSPNNNSIMSAVPKGKLGVASALIATVRNTGFFTGVGLGTGLYSWKAQGGNLVEALHFSMVFAGLAAVASLIASFGKNKGPHWKEVKNV